MSRPGTLTDDNLVDARTDSLLAAVTDSCAAGNASYGAALLNLSAGHIECAAFAHRQALQEWLQQARPSELIVPESARQADLDAAAVAVTRIADEDFDISRGQAMLQRHFGYDICQVTDLSADSPALGAAAAALRYAQATQCQSLDFVSRITYQAASACIGIDAGSRRNLEIDQRVNGATDFTLFALMDTTQTPMGSRLLRRWLHQPLRDARGALSRQSWVSAVISTGVHADLRAQLTGMGDLDRILARVALGSASPRDVVKLGAALSRLPAVLTLVEHVAAPHNTQFTTSLQTFDDLSSLVGDALVEDPPATIRDGGFIAPGYDAALDELRNTSEHAAEYLAAMERDERERTGITNLKVGYNRVHGYYIEITKAARGEIPADYVRRQTLKNAERYITPELKTFEERALTAQSKALQREKALFEDIVSRIDAQQQRLRLSVEALAQIDVLCTFAERARALDFAAPGLVEDPGLEISEGWHPVIKAASSAPFIANDAYLTDSRRTLILTGPNMGGKSTYMRQVALICLLAYTGSYVPARRANIGPLDRIFTRIGAADDLAGGRSTFMVEMTETAYILHNATDRSLVLLDEIGRGTSTFDGLALAWATAEQLAANIRAFTLFATHYFEMTALPDACPEADNVHMSAVEHEGDIVFRYQLEAGPANQSYGIQVAKLAGVPAQVLDTARRKLAAFEQGIVDPVQGDLFHVPQPTSAAPPPHSAVAARLAELDLDDVSPRAALDLLYELRGLLDGK